MEYQKGYTLLFNAITDARDAMENLNFGWAGELLRRAQVDAEEWYLTDSDGEKPEAELEPEPEA